MKKLSPKFFIIVFAFVAFSCSTESNEEMNQSNILTEQKYEYSNFELEVLDLVNEYRVSVNLPALEIIDYISYVAQTHNEQMILTGNVNHEGFEERKDVLKDNLNALAVRENVAYGYSTPQSVVNAWVNSASHRIVLESSYSHFGLSVRTDDEGNTYFTNIFIQI